MRFRIFLFFFIITLSCVWTLNLSLKYLGDSLYWQVMAKGSHIFTASLNSKIADNKIESAVVKSQGPDVRAKSAISVFIDEQGNQKVLYEKNSYSPLPIASLTKLMTANIAFDYFNQDQLIQISEKAVNQKESSGKLQIGQVFSVRDLLYMSLIESSNDAAYALSEVLSEDSFVSLMNLEAKNIGLDRTYFANPTGLDYIDKLSYSSSRDLVKFVNYLINKHPEILTITGTKELDIYYNGLFHHKIVNTNKLLGQKVIAGKTGKTPKAGECLLVILKAPKSGIIINVILGSENRFKEMNSLINYVEGAYIF